MASYPPIQMQACSACQLINQVSVIGGGSPQFPELAVGVTRRLRRIGRSGKCRGVSQLLPNSVAIARALPVHNTFSGVSAAVQRNGSSVFLRVQ
jgi:hypothetical protein